MSSDPFAQYRVDDAPTTDNEEMQRLSDLVQKLREVGEATAEAEAALKRLQDEKRRLEEFELPELMDSLGLAEFRDRSGLHVRVTRQIRASIGSRKAEAFAWLENNGYGALIKRTVEAAFGREQAEDAKRVLTTLQREFGGNVRQQMKVEPATLTAFVREQLAEGKEIPADVFGIYEQRCARIES